MARLRKGARSLFGSQRRAARGRFERGALNQGAGMTTVQSGAPGLTTTKAPFIEQVVEHHLFFYYFCDIAVFI